MLQPAVLAQCKHGEKQENATLLSKVTTFLLHNICLVEKPKSEIVCCDFTPSSALSCFSSVQWF